jgi:hypothetical protein
VTSLKRTIMSRQSDIGCRSSLKNRTFLPFFPFLVGQLAIAKSTVPLAIASLFALVIPNRPVVAMNEFQLCTAQLVRLAGVSPDGAVAACSDALNPKEISRCVVTIHKLTPTLTPDALVACQRVRRPVELSRCMFDITDNTRDSQPITVLDYCRRSLLPLRYAQCVVGLSRETDFSSGQVMESCIKAEDFPGNLYPNVVPLPPQNPTLPVAVPKIPPPPPAKPMNSNS